MRDTALVALVTGLFGSVGIGSIITQWMKRNPPKGSREDKLIDQLQEENTRLSGRIDVLEARAAATLGYVFDLQRHIAEGQPPPPPPFPPNLLTGR